MKWWRIERRVACRLNGKQKKALKGGIPMTKELFWDCLSILWARQEMPRFWQLWNRYPEYVQQFKDAFRATMADPDTDLRKKHDEWWANLEPKLANAQKLASTGNISGKFSTKLR